VSTLHRQGFLKATHGITLSCQSQHQTDPPTQNTLVIAKSHPGPLPGCVELAGSSVCSLSQLCVQLEPACRHSMPHLKGPHTQLQLEHQQDWGTELTAGWATSSPAAAAASDSHPQRPPPTAAVVCQLPDCCCTCCPQPAAPTAAA
jgi:hypothetical protein